MIQMQTSLAVADNSGAKRVEMIAPIGGSIWRRFFYRHLDLVTQSRDLRR